MKIPHPQKASVGHPEKNAHREKSTQGNPTHRKSKQREFAMPINLGLED
jgi:hypothetical protein